MTERSKQGLATRSIHGQGLRDAHGSPHVPVYDTTTFAFGSTAELLDVIDGRKPGSLYTRYGMNPSILALENTLAGLEGADMAWAFSSGMAAESALFLAHGREGIVCIGDAYGGTLELLAKQLPLLGITTHLLLGSEMDRLEAVLAGGARLVFLETPTNPTLDVFDIRAIARQAHAHGALLAVDNTFAGEPAPAGTRRRSGHAQRDEVSRWSQRSHRGRADGRAGTAAAGMGVAQEPRVDDRAGHRIPAVAQPAHPGRARAPA